jgi:hypothetical protein
VISNICPMSPRGGMMNQHADNNVLYFRLQVIDFAPECRGRHWFGSPSNICAPQLRRFGLSYSCAIRGRKSNNIIPILAMLDSSGETFAGAAP